MDVPVLANIVILTLGLAIGGFQLLVFARLPTRHHALWTGLVALSAALYSGCMVGLYQAEPGLRALVLHKALYAAVVLICHGVPSLAAALNGRRIPHWRWLGPASAGGWILLVVATPWVVSSSFVPLDLALTSAPYPLFVAPPVTAAYIAGNLGVGAMGVGWLFLTAPPGRPAYRMLGLAFGVWALAGLVDSAVVLRLLDTVPMFFSEYGTLAVVIAHAAHDLGDYTRLIAEERRNFSDLIDRSPELNAVHRDGRFVYLNQSGAEFLGYDDPAELIGAPVMEIVHPEDRLQVAAQLADLETTGSLPMTEERFVRRDGSILRAEVMALRVRFDGEPSVLVLGRDLSERLELEARMRQLDRMVAVGTLAAGVAHEINNPLTYIQGNLEHVAQRLALGEIDPFELANAVDDAREGGRRIRRIVKDLSGMARADEQNLCEVSVADAVDSAIRLTSNEVRHRARLVRDLEPVAPVVADASRLSQVVINLLLNATHAIPVGYRDMHTITVRTRARGEQVALEVEDDGAGIDPQVRERLFDPFVTTKERGAGTGLGLAICRQIVEDFGGTFEVETEVGRGSLFRVVLRGTTAAVAEPAPVEAPQPPESNGRARLLVVDDEALVLRTLERALGRHHDVRTTSRAQAALDVLDEGARFDVILCDLMMPDTSGMEFFAEVETRYPELLGRIVFMTGGAFSEDGQAFLRQDRVRYVSKPVDTRRLLELVDATVRSGAGPARPRVY